MRAIILNAVNQPCRRRRRYHVRRRPGDVRQLHGGKVAVACIAEVVAIAAARFFILHREEGSDNKQCCFGI